MRTVRRIFWVVLVCLIVAGTAAANLKLDILSGWAFAGLVAWWFVGMFFARQIGTMLIGSLRCKGCGLEIPAVGRWKVGSYTDHRDRHIFSAKNPTDGSRIGQIDCPQCSSTILV